MFLLKNWVGFALLLECIRVVSNQMTNTNQYFDNADLTQNYTMRKDWNFDFLSAAWGATYTLY